MLEFRAASGDIAWVLPSSDGSRTVVFSSRSGGGALRDGVTLVAEFDAKGELRKPATIYDIDGNDITDGDIGPLGDWIDRLLGEANGNQRSFDIAGGFVLTGGAFEYVWQGATYTRRDDGLYSRNLGENQYDLVDPTTGQRFLEAGGMRIPVGRDQSIVLSSDSGEASIVAKCGLKSEVQQPPASMSG